MASIFGNMEPASFSPSTSPTRVAGSLAETDTVTVEQLHSARETFFDLETAYRKFKYELESIREEHRNEVSLKISFKRKLKPDFG